jgi:hypothetical protein
MDQNHDDYAEPGQSRPWQSPAWGLPVATVVLLLALCGTGLLIGFILLTLAWMSNAARS